MKKILLPTDFSNNARNAAEYAIEMFGYNDVEYILLNTYTEIFITTDVLISIIKLLKKELKEG